MFAWLPTIPVLPGPIVIFVSTDTVVPTAISNSYTGLRSGNTQRYIKPRAHTKFGDRSFSSNKPRICHYLEHSLSPYLHGITDTVKFKRSRKWHFLSLTFFA